MGELDAAEARRSPGLSQDLGVEDGPFETEPQIPVAGGDDAAEAGAVAAGHTGLEGQLCRRAVLGAAAV